MTRPFTHPSRLLDAIQGHAARTAGDGYGDVTVKAMAMAMKRVPRVDVWGQEPSHWTVSTEAMIAVWFKKSRIMQRSDQAKRRGREGDDRRPENDP
jgi:hypothetical protein